MAVVDKNVFLVNTDGTTVMVRIRGRASYLNCQPISEFLNKMVANGKMKYCFFFDDCTGIDSTFLGILAGLAIEIRKKNGVCMLFGLNSRQLDIVKTLGIDRIVQIVNNTNSIDGKWENLTDESCANKELIEEAHRTLCELNDSNRVKFQDVVRFLSQNNPQFQQ